jgi:hypothetical protein
MKLQSGVLYSGPTTVLHLELIDGNLCLFDRENRLLSGVSSIDVLQKISDATEVTLTLFVERKPVE